MTIRLLSIALVLLLVGCGKDADYYMKRGNEYLASGHLVEAAREFEKAVKVEPGNYEALNSLGAVLSSIGQYERAVEYFERAVAVNDTLIEAHYNLGKALALSKRYREALDQFRKAAMLDSTYALA